MTNPELISFYDGYSRLNVRAKRDDETIVEIQYRKNSTFNCGARYKVRVALPGFKPTLTHEVGFDAQGVWIHTDRAGVAKMLEKCFFIGHIRQETLILMLRAIDDETLKSKSNTGLDAADGWVKMIDGEPQWGYWAMPEYD